MCMVGVVIAPMLVSLVSVGRHSWLPVGDEASILLRTQGVGTAQTPLVGVYSTHGWAHPGPALYFLLALPFRLMGGHPTNLLQAAALINIVTVGLIGFVAWRRRALTGVLMAMLFTATLLMGMRSDLVIGFWNPYLPLLMYFAYLLTSWSIAERDWALLPLWVGLGSLVVQMHVGYVPLIGAGAVVVAGSIARTHRQAPSRWTAPTTLVLRLTALVVVALWLPPMIDQMFGQGNLNTLAGYFKDAQGSTVGLSEGFGILSSHVRVGGPWMGGQERVAFGEVRPVALGAYLLLVALLTACVLVTHRALRRTAALPLLALVQLLVGGVAASRVERPLLSYLVVWMLPLAAFCWLAVSMTMAESVAELVRRRTTAARAPKVRRAAMACAALITLLPVASSLRGAGDPVLPRQERASALRSVLHQLDGKVDPSKLHRVEGIGDIFHENWVGVLYAFDRDGIRFVTSDGADGRKWTERHVYDGQSVQSFITVATSLPTSFEDPVAECQRDPSMVELALSEELSPAERAQLKGLQIANYEAEGKLDPADAKELKRLAARSYRLAVFEGSRKCGRPR